MTIKKVTPQAKVEKEVVEVETVAEKTVAPRVSKKIIDKTEEVACKSVQKGNLLYISPRSLMRVEWDDYGDIQYMPIEELLTMKSTQGKFLTEPWIIIDDENVVEFLGLRKIYDNLIPLEDISEFILQTPAEDLEAFLKVAPKGLKELVADHARDLVASDQLYDIRIMKLLDRVLNIDLTMIQN